MNVMKSAIYLISQDVWLTVVCMMGVLIPCGRRQEPHGVHQHRLLVLRVHARRYRHHTWNEFLFRTFNETVEILKIKKIK